MHRRQLLRLGMSLLAAPAIVRATSLMPVRPFIEVPNWPFSTAALDIDFVNGRIWSDGTIKWVAAWARGLSNDDLQRLTE
jgi:hypothetical protein